MGPDAMKRLRAPRKTPQQRRSQETVEAILDAAAQLFSESGFDSVSTNAVAARAGVSIGSFYQYFPNKLALLEALRECHVKRLWGEIGSACDEACTIPWPAALKHVVARCGRFNGRNVALMRVLHKELPIHAREIDRMMMAEAAFHGQFRKLLEAHKGAFRVSVDQAMFMLPALGRGIFSAAAIQQPEAVENERLVDEVVSAMLGYLRGESGR